MTDSILAYLLAASLFSSLKTTPPTDLQTFDETFEHHFESRASTLATASWETLKTRTKYRWPVQVKSIGHTTASYQRYGSVSGAYFHHGLDIRADAGSPVVASAGGKVVNIENYVPGNPAYWEVAILDREGFIWQYHHIDRQSIPQEIFTAYKNGTEIAAGAKIGEVVYWGIVTFGERYHHVHLNILGAQKQYLNPFEFLEPLNDTSGPQIKEFLLVKDGQKLNTSHVSGRYSIGLHVEDLILSQVFTLPPNRIEVQIDDQTPIEVWKFDTLPGASDKEAFVNQFYIPSLACGDYSCRRPIIDLGFRKAPSQVFPTQKGRHEIFVRVEDFSGNSDSRSFSWIVD